MGEYDSYGRFAFLVYAAVLGAAAFVVLTLGFIVGRAF